MANVWKIAPGQSASDWPMCSNKGCVVIDFREVGDYRKYETEDEVVEALGPGTNGGPRRGAARSVWHFANDVEEGHVVVANKGLSAVVGIGIVRSKYLPPGSPDNPSDNEWLPNARLVDWQVEEPVRLRSHFFADQTVRPLSREQCDAIKRAYSRKRASMSKRVASLLDEAAQGDDDEAAWSGAEETDIEGLKTEFHSIKSKRSRRLRNKAFEAAKGICAGSRFTRTVDLVEWLPGIYHPDSKMWPKEPLRPDEVVLSQELPAIEVYPKKDESLRHHFFLPTILWED